MEKKAHSHPPVRFAVIGSRRGRSFINSARSLGDAVRLVAICDNDPQVLQQWKVGVGDTVCLYNDYEQVLNAPDIDAVCIATPFPMHARQSIDAIRAGKHVLSEVIAAHTMEDCWELLETVRASDCTYMMAENYCFMEPNMQVQRMVEEGVFGDIVYASGSYLHDTRRLLFREDCSLTWRGEIARTYAGHTYPTHSLGPVARWLGINRTDKLKSTATWGSRVAGNAYWAGKRMPHVQKYQEKGFWRRPDTLSTHIRTEKGALIDLRADWTSNRPHNMNRYELQGTKASFFWTDGAEPMIWIEGRSEMNPHDHTAVQWESLWKYRDEFEHPWWREYRAQANVTGHGGGDYFVLKEFVAAIHEGRSPTIDVCDAVTWSSLFPLSVESVRNNNASVEVPDFSGGRR